MAKTYSDILKNPLWQRKRLEIFQRDGFRCKLCDDDTKTLHVHHLEYGDFNKPWSVGDDKLITYCELCHDIAEQFKKHGITIRKITWDNYNNKPRGVIYMKSPMDSTIVICEVIDEGVNYLSTLTISDLETCLNNLKSFKDAAQ